MSEQPIDLSQSAEFAFIREIETELGLSPQFIQSLAKDDDWSFVIKLHALLEAAATHLITTTLANEKLRDVVSRLEMSNQATGKLGIIKALELLDSDARRFIQKLSELRNQFVHNVANVNTEIGRFLSELPKEERQGFDKAFKWGHKSTSTVTISEDGKLFDLQETIKLIAIILVEIPSLYRMGIWLGALIVLRKMYGIIASEKLSQDARLLTRELLASNNTLRDLILSKCSLEDDGP